MTGSVVTWQVVAIVAGFLGSIACSTAFLTWFIAAQLSNNRRVFYRTISKHNREDDDRFAALQDNQYELREYLAQRDGTAMPQRKTFPRRRYLIDDSSDMPS
jgi:hypothetical protein